ncbi:MAG: histidinol-phosphate transaminase [Clostridia bacterium]|nr:histidinol-phosphate transaminase [Clostridia bacterium]
MNRFWNENTRSLTPYVPGEQPKDKKLIKINTNESPYPPSPLVIERIRNADLNDLRLYPDPDSTPLKKAVAEFYGISEQEVFPGNGSDEVLALLFKAYFDASTPIAFPDITYSFYPVYSELYNVPYTRVPVKDDFSIDFNAYPSDVKAILFANPNAPTGLYIDRAEIEALLRRRPETLIILDEAYIDFGGESCVPLINSYDNLIVVQTLSKSRALAGMRIGLAFGAPSLMEGLDRVKNSFNSYTMDRLAIVAAEAAFQDKAYFEETCKKVIRTREWTKEAFKEMGVEVTDSQTNFLFASLPGVPGPQVQARLRQEGILVRNFKASRTENWLRISIGTDEEMKKLVEAVKKVMAGAAL